MSHNIEQEVANKIVRIRGQLQIVNNALVEMTSQLMELANNLSSLIGEVQRLRMEIQELKKLREEPIKPSVEQEGKKSKPKK